jgi:hypothetical protein
LQIKIEEMIDQSVSIDQRNPDGANKLGDDEILFDGGQNIGVTDAKLRKRHGVVGYVGWALNDVVEGIRYNM